MGYFQVKRWKQEALTWGDEIKKDLSYRLAEFVRLDMTSDEIESGIWRSVHEALRPDSGDPPGRSRRADVMYADAGIFAGRTDQPELAHAAQRCFASTSRGLAPQDYRYEIAAKWLGEMSAILIEDLILKRAAEQAHTEGQGVSHSAGWYSDPDEPSQLRYWDGEAWTSHTAPPQSV